jgi:hypothetical protein
MASQFTVEKPTFGKAFTGREFLAATDAATTLTGDQTAHAIVTMTPGAARNLTTATAAQIVAAIPEPRAGTCFELTVINGAAATHAITLVAGSGVTLGGVAGMATIAAASSATYLGRITATGTPAVTFYRK